MEAYLAGEELVRVAVLRCAKLTDYNGSMVPEVLVRQSFRSERSEELSSSSDSEASPGRSTSALKNWKSFTSPGKLRTGESLATIHRCSLTIHELAADI